MKLESQSNAFFFTFYQIRKFVVITLIMNWEHSACFAIGKCLDFIGLNLHGKTCCN